MKTILAVVSIVNFGVLSTLAQQVPPLINYQGLLTTATGAAMPGGTYTIQFRLWDDPQATNASDLIWDQQLVATVQTNGVFDVVLGSSAGSQISGVTPMVNSLSLAFTQTNRFFGITVTGSNSIPILNAGEILPRQQLLSVPYAFLALNAANATSAVNGVPVGTVLPFAGTVAPSGYLLCDGNSYSSTTYPSLFAAISNVWGPGSGPNSFTVPDLRGRTLFGAGSGGLDANGNPLSLRPVAQIGGAETHTLTIAEMPAHVHSVTCVEAHWGSSSDGFINNNALTASGSYNTQATGGSQPHTIMPPFAVVNYIIKY